MAGSVGIRRQVAFSLSLDGDSKVILTVISTITMVYLSAIHDVAQTVGHIKQSSFGCHG